LLSKRNEGAVELRISPDSYTTADELINVTQRASLKNDRRRPQKQHSPLRIKVKSMDDHAEKNELARRIRERAYRIWVDDGKPAGKSEDHLLQAKQEIEKENQ
jgi:hypothetical protein